MIATLLLDAIRAEMERQGLSQRALARRAGIHQSDVNRMLRREDPSLRSIDKFLDGLGCEVNVTLTPKGYEPPAADWYDMLAADLDSLEDQLDRALETDDTRRRNHSGAELYGKLGRAAKNLTEHVATNGPDERAHDLDVRINALRARVLSDVFCLSTARNGR